MNDLAISERGQLPEAVEALNQAKIKFAAQVAKLRSLGWRQPKGQEEIYFIRAGNGLIKIGITNNIKYRLDALRTMSPVELTLLGTWSGNQKLETKIHQYLKKYRQHGEWFLLGPGFIEKLNTALEEYINE